MPRERITLIDESTNHELVLRQKILSGKITPEIFEKMPPEEQKKVMNILFQISSEKVEPHVGVSTLEFIVFAFMRLMYKRIHGMSLTAEDMQIEKDLKDILEMHQITNLDVSRKDWDFDYMQYAKAQSSRILNNRKQHVERKRNVTGHV